jgi:acetyl esterase
MPAQPPPRIDRDVRYSDQHDALVLDVHRPGPGSPASTGAVVLVHGGGWFRGDKSKEDGLSARLVDAGYTVFVPNYRLAPTDVFPASRDDVLTAHEWALQSGIPFDRSKVAFFGGSAGGNLAVEGGIATGRPSVSWSGIFGLAEIIRATDGTVSAAPTTQDLDAMRSADIDQTGRDDPFLRWVILQEVGGDRSALDAASTIGHVTSSTGPVYLANSLDEWVPRSDPIALQAALAAVGVPNTLQLIPGLRHAEGYTDHALPGSLAFLAQTLGVEHR